MAEPVVRSYQFAAHQEVLQCKSFPIVKLEAHEVTLSIYGVVRKDGKVLLQEDYTNFVKRGREGIKQPDGRFAFPFLAIQWIPESQRKHNEFCFVYNLYKEDDSFLGHRRCDSTFVLTRGQQPKPGPTVSQNNEPPNKRKGSNLAIEPMQLDNDNYEDPELKVTSANDYFNNIDKSQNTIKYAIPKEKRQKFVTAVQTVSKNDTLKDCYWISTVYQLLNDPNKKGEAIGFWKIFGECAASLTRALLADENGFSPTNNLGIAGGIKYFIGGMFLKFIGDGNHVSCYGNLESSMKAAGNELTALKAMYQIGTELDLRFPMMALVDYCGWRFIAVSELPINQGTIVYGSQSGPMGPFYQKLPQVTQAMETMLQRLNLKTQDTSLGKFRSAFDLEAHVGTDGNKYILDLSRVMPPNDVDGKHTYMYRLFRPEFVKSYSQELPTEIRMAKELMEARQYYYEISIPKVAQLLTETCIPDTPIGKVISLLHYHGVNLRNMGDICRLVAAEIQNIFITEMISRCIKHQIRQVMRSVKKPTPENLRGPILNFFNTKFFTTTAEFWSELQNQFNSNFFRANNSAPTFDLTIWKNSISSVTIFQRVCELTAIKFHKSTQGKINGWSLEEPLTEEDFRTPNCFGSTVKTMVPILFHQQATLGNKQYDYARPELPQDPENRVHPFQQPDQPVKAQDGLYFFENIYQDAMAWQFVIRQDSKIFQEQFDLCKKLKHDNLLDISSDIWTIWHDRYVVLKDPISVHHTTLRQDLENSQMRPDLQHASVSYLHNIEGILHIVTGIARGLGFLHSKGIPYRHLVPENVWIFRNELRAKSMLFTPAIMNPLLPDIQAPCLPRDLLDESSFKLGSDIYCFGLLLETLVNEFIRERRRIWRQDMKDKKFENAKEVEAQIQKDIGQSFDGEIRYLRNLASKCTNPALEARPSIYEVLKLIEDTEVSISSNHPLLQVFGINMNELTNMSSFEDGQIIQNGTAIYQGKKISIRRQETYSTYESLEMTQRRGKLNKLLDHENIRKFYGISYLISDTKVILYWCEEDCKDTLSDFLKEANNLPREKAISIILGITRGVAHIHEKRISIRNLTTHGIWLDELLVPKIVSFEQAIAEDQTQFDMRSLIPEIFDKVYKAPELISNDKEVFNLTVDIYALGIMIWEILTCMKTHKVPFSDLIEVSQEALQPVVALMKIVQEGKRPNLADVPKEFHAIISRCWSHDPKERPTAHEAMLILQEIINHMDQ